MSRSLFDNAAARRDSLPFAELPDGASATVYYRSERYRIMEIKMLEYDFSVCKVADYSLTDLCGEFIFIGKTDEENSLVCPTADVPPNATERDDGWRAFRIQGILDFSLIGILSEISRILAENGIGIFAVSTFNTDYILTKSENFRRAAEALANAGYTVTD